MSWKGVLGYSMARRWVMGEEDQIKEEEGKRVNKKVVQEVTR